MPVDPESRNHLEDVRRGKPRNFVMVCKGVKILGLVLYKLGSLETYKKKVKESGKGTIYHGLAAGKGENITFYLRSSDGFDKPPGKELTLKDFLKAEAGLKFKPSYEIVAEFPAAAGDEQAEDEGPSSDGPLAGWQAERAAAVASLKRVAKQIAMANHPKSAAAILEIKAVIANLTESPSTPQQVLELERYLTEDDVVRDVCEMGEDIGTPLLERLADLKTQLSE